MHPPRIQHLACAAAAALTFGVGATPAAAEPTCSETAALMARACRADSLDDWLTAQAVCENLSDSQAQDRCETAARRDYREARDNCSAVQDWRGQLCSLVGEAPYDPPFDPLAFDRNFGGLSFPNPYRPLVIGQRWAYAGDGETTEIEVLDQTRDAEGVTCIVVRDLVYEDGRLTEATDDWFAAGLDGSTWYCGEESKDYEWNDADVPPRAELVSIDGSFKHGREGAKAGIIMPSAPTPGVAYREEFALGEAEDVGEVVAVGWSYGQDPLLDRFVPPVLAQLLCNSDCLVTRHFSLEPGVVELKYHARGIGTFAETDPAEGLKLQLVGCNFDPRCQSLPQP